MIAVGTWAAFENGKISIAVNSYNTVILALLSSVCISGGVMLILMKAPMIKTLDFIGKHTLPFLGYHIPLLRFFEFWSVTEHFSEVHPLWIEAVVVVLLIPIVYIIDRFLPILEGKIPAKRRAVSA